MILMSLYVFKYYMCMFIFIISDPVEYKPGMFSFTSRP